MGRTAVFLGIVCSIAFGAAACSRTADDRAQRQEAALAVRDAQTGDEITVTGCLTGASDRGAFAVTADRDPLASSTIHAASGDMPTYTYELTGNTADLAAHVGRQVKVTGRLDQARKDQVKVNDETEAKEPPRQAGDEKVTPAVKTDAEVDLHVRRLNVTSLTPTGSACVTNSSNNTNNPTTTGNAGAANDRNNAPAAGKANQPNRKK